MGGNGDPNNNLHHQLLQMQWVAAAAASGRPTGQAAMSAAQVQQAVAAAAAAAQHQQQQSQGWRLPELLTCTAFVFNLTASLTFSTYVHSGRIQCLVDFVKNSHRTFSSNSRTRAAEAAAAADQGTDLAWTRSSAAGRRARAPPGRPRAAAAAATQNRLKIREYPRDSVSSATP